MTDRELLEAAAKAAGVELVRSRLDDPMWRDMAAKPVNGIGVGWNPLTDDGDALRLAVRLNLTLRCYMGNTCAQTTTPGGLSVYIDETNHSDPDAATRRAIVRAAAAIGDQQ